MIEIIFLGTGSMQPTKTRNHSGIFLKYREENILLDCGEGIQRQMRIAGIKPAKITKLLISHWHGDHVFGIPGLLSAMGADQFSKKLTIYGPPKTKEYLQHMLKSFAAKNIIDFEVHEVKSGIIFENKQFILEAKQLKHSTVCIGYSFSEKDRLRIDIKKAKQWNVSGPILGKIQQGESVHVNGKVITAADITYKVRGKKISYIADTIPCSGADALAKNADLLIAEGTHLDEIKDKTKKYMHLTVKETALIAKKNKAKKLVVT
ncbi:MAG: ribonuclease Z, partial [Nanoarchaeota archaeon]|nr:ribonuclease Z [Nanoarchaeota archaeon]